MNNEKIVNSIKKLCKKHNITANQLECEVGLSQGLISRWLKTTPSLDKIINIADYFNVSLDEVIGRKKNGLKQNKFFINQIYEMTQSGELAWGEAYLLSYADKVRHKIGRYINGLNMDETDFFVADYNLGHIMLLMQYDIDYGSVEEYKIDLFLQADDFSEIIHEDCDEEQLYELWECVRSKIYVESNEDNIKNFKEEIIANHVKEDEQLHEKISQIDLERIKLIQEMLKPEYAEAINTLNKLITNKK